MSEVNSHSVTLWIQELKSGHDAAATQLWDRYFARMVALARQKLGNAEKRVADEEDLAASVFQCLCSGAAEGKFDELEDRDDLWMLLVAITKHKAVDHVRRQTSRKRGSGQVRGNSIYEGNDDTGGAFDGVFSDEPTPELLVSMDEERQRLLELLSDESQRSIARMKLMGHANMEISQSLGVSLRTVERKLGVIRDTWSQEFNADG